MFDGLGLALYSLGAVESALGLSGRSCCLEVDVIAKPY